VFRASGSSTPLQTPEIHYALSGDVSIAYAVIGGGPVDLVFVYGFVGNLDFGFEIPQFARCYERLASFSRLIAFDRRGTGLSDRPREAATLESRMDDVRAVLDAVGSERAVLFGSFEAASMCLLFAATYPERVLGLVLYNPIAKGTWAPDYPWADRPEARTELDEMRRTWGTPEFAQGLAREMAPSLADDPDFIRSIARLHRLGASPGAVVTIMRMAADVDIRDVLPAIRVPTLVLNMPTRRGEAEYVAGRIPKARRLDVAGPDFMILLLGDSVYDEIQRFVESVRGETPPDTVLATILFTDIVRSTETTAVLGDRDWAELVARHHAVVRGHLDRFRGRELDTAGDGFFATFDGPVRAIRCADTITRAVRDLGLEVRAGVHTGECELVDGKVAGIAVNIGARVASRAGPGEVLVSQTVKDLVAGSGVEFEDRGAAELKGVPGEWRLYAVAEAAS
jgi:class 3 adenylate cyclase/pimeloyl-ACP methyl ester carboxylesterase